MGNVLHRGKGSFTHVENTIFFDQWPVGQGERDLLPDSLP